MKSHKVRADLRDAVLPRDERRLVHMRNDRGLRPRQRKAKERKVKEDLK